MSRSTHCRLAIAKAVIITKVAEIKVVETKVVEAKAAMSRSMYATLPCPTQHL